jgi:LCP family protein required for cell wall assembly
MPPLQSPPPLRPRPSRFSRLRGSKVLLMLIAMPAGLLLGLLAAQSLVHLFQQRPAGQTAALPGAFRGWLNSEGQTILLLGTDVSGGNTDVIALIKVEQGVTDVVQIPRDSYIEAETYGPIKINALYALGGIDAVKQEISTHMGRSIQHYIVINLAAVRQLGDMLGGLEINVPKRMAYVDNSQGLNIDLQPGLQTLKGTDLEGFLRFRHDEAGDIGRIDRQQLALRALFSKLGRPETLVRLPALLVKMGKEVQTDMGPIDLGGMATALGGTQLHTKQLGGRPFDQNGISYWEADWPQPIGSSPSTDSKQSAIKESYTMDGGDRNSGEQESHRQPQRESPGQSKSERYLF